MILLLYLFPWLFYQGLVSHQAWDLLLKKHVSQDGSVNYAGFLRDRKELQDYLDRLSANPPEERWTRNETMAFWINAYNAFTVKLVLDHYPVHSIRYIRKGIPFINSVWDMPFIQIGGEKMDLNHIEHGILRRQFREPRIHAAINSGSISCPVLRNEAFNPSRLGWQLDDAMRQFINDRQRNQLQGSTIRISKIFSWFSTDFRINGAPLTDYLNRYARIPVPRRTKVEYLPFDWRLNEMRPVRFISKKASR